jgi:uncharacterized protein YjbI with pentapeptide repeats
MKDLFSLCSAAFFYISIFFFAIGVCWRYSDQIQANLNKLKSTKSCSGCDLTAVELVGFDLRNANLNGFANLSRANLTDAKLDGVILTDDQDSMLLN